MFLMVISQSFDVFFEGNAFHGVQVQSSCGGPWVSSHVRKRSGRQRRQVTTEGLTQAQLHVSAPNIRRIHFWLKQHK